MLIHRDRMPEPFPHPAMATWTPYYSLLGQEIQRVVADLPWGAGGQAQGHMPGQAPQGQMPGQAPHGQMPGQAPGQASSPYGAAPTPYPYGGGSTGAGPAAGAHGSTVNPYSTAPGGMPTTPGGSGYAGSGFPGQQPPVGHLPQVVPGPLAGQQQHPQQQQQQQQQPASSSYGPGGSFADLTASTGSATGTSPRVGPLSTRISRDQVTMELSRLDMDIIQMLATGGALGQWAVPDLVDLFLDGLLQSTLADVPDFPIELATQDPACAGASPATASEASSPAVTESDGGTGSGDPPGDDPSGGLSTMSGDLRRDLPAVGASSPPGQAAPTPEEITRAYVESTLLPVEDIAAVIAASVSHPSSIISGLAQEAARLDQWSERNALLARRNLDLLGDAELLPRSLLGPGAEDLQARLTAAAAAAAAGPALPGAPAPPPADATLAGLAARHAQLASQHEDLRAAVAARRARLHQLLAHYSLQTVHQALHAEASAAEQASEQTRQQLLALRAASDDDMEAAPDMIEQFRLQRKAHHRAKLLATTQLHSQLRL
ncbi:hypothetical protein H696_02211 [Fonticula alba]|uniref:VPS37 C-terminal domain-containing protein n=1 Tax=Fonticula alba TaxID=691883 RepID=A0A058ZAB3_FONAL|nr:hypothetical protein H696_02211 [Fonticula alba]KCV71264.1 hypothetical protein H696_02211 [Fonticula alba]|eukprot:XP_009494387.1 hypothetical protein H696_02211 [Fonticula alba]